MLSFGTVTLACSVQGGRGNSINIVWSGPPNINSPIPLPENSLSSDTVTSSLTLSNIDHSFIGSYICIANYTSTSCSGTSESEPGFLYIVEAPTIITTPEPPQQNVTVGSSVFYSCSFNASEASSRLSFNTELANFSVYWLGPDGNISLPGQCGSQVCVSLSQNEETVNITLTLTNLSSVHGGLHTCVAENIDGIANGSSLLFVQPVINPTFYTTINESLTILCDVQSNPEPMFRWEKEITGSPGSYETLNILIDISGNDRNINITSQSLNLSPVIFGDEGLYRCAVTTDVFGTARSNSALVTGMHGK